MHLAGVGAWDPQGGDGEHDADAPKATDGDPATYWTTEHYQSFNKPGVGVVLEAPSAKGLKSVTVTTDTPGFTAEISPGRARRGRSRPSRRRASSATARALRFQGLKPAKFYVVWITQLPPGSDTAHVNEVSATG